MTIPAGKRTIVMPGWFEPRSWRLGHQNLFLRQHRHPVTADVKSIQIMGHQKNG
jgi:hypothetical protein